MLTNALYCYSTMDEEFCDEGPQQPENSSKSLVKPYASRKG